MGPAVLSETAALFPDKFMLYTEACAGFEAKLDEKVLLGDWGRAELYANDIIDVRKCNFNLFYSFHINNTKKYLKLVN